MTSPATATEHVPDYRAVICRKETKTRLQAFGKALPDSGFLCERRVVTGLLEIALEACAEHPDLLQRLIQRIPDIAQRDQDSLRAASTAPTRPKT